MRQASRVLVLVALISALLPTEAAAQRGFREWLEKLSGPGPFVGYVWSLPLYCVPVGPPKPGETVEQSQVGLKLPPFITWDCWYEHPDRKRVTFVYEFTIGDLVSSENTHVYDPVAGVGTEVRASKWLVAADLRVQRWLDLGLGLGSITFKGDRFDEFSCLVLQPLRVHVRPLALMRYDRRGSWREFLTFSVVTNSLATARDSDFNATKTDFSTGQEFNTSFALTVDLLKLIDRAVPR
jgi:hypothetical protein